MIVPCEYGVPLAFNGILSSLIPVIKPRCRSDTRFILFSMNENLVKKRYVFMDEKKKVDEPEQSHELHQRHQFQIILSLQINVLKVQISAGLSEKCETFGRNSGFMPS